MKVTHRFTVLHQTKKHDIFSSQTDSWVQRIFRFGLQHFVQQGPRHVNKILRQQFVPMDGNQGRAILEEVCSTDFLSHTIKRDAWANIYGRHEHTFAKTCDKIISTSDKRIDLTANYLSSVTHPSIHLIWTCGRLEANSLKANHVAEGPRCRCRSWKQGKMFSTDAFLFYYQRYQRNNA